MNLKDLPSHVVDALTFGDIAYLGPREDVSAQLLTRSLENNLNWLESLRKSLDRAGAKDIIDVRDFGETMAGDLLAGYESGITYQDLLDLIDAYKKGLASRYLAA